MDSITIIGFTIVGFIALLLIIFWAGFRRRVPGFRPEVQVPVHETITIPDHFPDALKKHVRSVFDCGEMPLVRSAVIWGTAAYKISNLWMPLRYMTHVHSGRGFLREMEFFWHGKIILKGIDFFLKGVGAVQANGVIRMNESGKRVTESQWISYWAEGIVTATLDIADPSLRWEPVNDQQVNLYLPPVPTKTAQDQACVLRIGFHPVTGRIDTIRTERFRGQLENKRVPWCLRVSGWHRRDHGWIPDYSVRWEDQKKPWCYYKLEGFVRNVPVEQSFHKIDPERYRKETIYRKAKSRTQS